VSVGLGQADSFVEVTNHRHGLTAIFNADLSAETTASSGSRSRSSHFQRASIWCYDATGGRYEGNFTLFYSGLGEHLYLSP
jgi:hypothetical protein